MFVVVVVLMISTERCTRRSTERCTRRMMIRKRRTETEDDDNDDAMSTSPDRKYDMVEEVVVGGAMTNFLVSWPT